jgi:cytochrome c-type biogenesis protein CcmH/NrfG
MLLVGTVLALAVALVGAIAWWLLRARRMPIGNFVGVIALAVWLVGVVVALALDHAPQGRSELVRSMDSLAWPVAPQSPLVAHDAAPAPTSSSASAGQVASVESLIGGLEARLAAKPDDANGWALLAQSYAYGANDAGVERAIARAVALGVDEQTLRERVNQAKRSAHPGGVQAQATAGPRL